MSEYEESYEQNEGEESNQGSGNGPKELREAFNRQKEENAKLRQELRERDLKDFTKSKGLPDKVIGLIGDQDPEDWFKEYGEMFTPQANSAGEVNNANTENQNVEVEDVEEGGAPRQLTPEEIQLAQATGPRGGVFDPTSDAQLHSQLDNAEKASASAEDFYAELAKMGALAPDAIV